MRLRTRNFRSHVTLPVTVPPSYWWVEGGGWRCSVGRWLLGSVALALLACVTACQGPTSTPTPSTEAASAAGSPSPAAAAAASPSPGLAQPSPSASPAPVASPSPAVVTQGSPFAVMIDNISAARPQVGLADADVIYEAPAEGGIPRLMPIYLRAGTDVDR